MSNTICGICRDENTSFETRCGHLFHQECLSLWLNEQNVCPYCRTKITSNKSFEYALRYYKGEEEALKGMSEYEIIEMLCHFCIKKIDNFESIISALMKLDWKLDDPLDHDGKTLMSVACESDNLPMIYHLIKIGVDINQFDYRLNQYPVIYAVKKGNLELLDFLIDHGANLNLHEKYHTNAPIFFACTYAKLPVVERLLQANLDVNVRSNENYTPLHALSVNSQDKDSNRLTIAKLLISKGAQINARDSVHFTPLHYAVKGGFKELVELFIEQGAYVNFRNSRRQTALHQAINDCNTELAKKLIELGADIKARDLLGRQPIHYAMMGQRNNSGDWEKVYKILETLVSAGADINAQTTRGATAFHYVHHDSELGILKKFVELGANISIEDRKGRDLAFRARKRGLSNIMSWIENINSKKILTND